MRTIKITDTNGDDYIIPENQIAFIKHEDNEYRQVYSLKLQCGTLIIIDYDTYDELAYFLVGEYDLSPMLKEPIEKLDLSVRSYNCLKRADIQTLGDLINHTESQIIRVNYLGKKSLKEIKEKLAERGLCFKDERNN